ncbi:MAG: molybdopterin molybdotransferase MoeA [Paracoccus sp. (in: a-proteobacteria)]|nr:molybdopterin molybdotransferase MoeA [Paracoccus sp. (in: a-proteobacteria)]
MISVAEALTQVLALAPAPNPERIAIQNAFGRALLRAEPAALDQPPFDSAAMDGYAMRKADLPGPLRVVGEVAAGHPWTGEARPGTALRIFTGAAVPPGFDRVEMQENCLRDGDFVTVRDISDDTADQTNIRPRGSDFAKGTRMPSGRVLRAPEIALLAAMNLSHVQVARRPVVAILAGGDELVRPGTPLGPGQIVSTNDLAIAALVHEAGGVPQILPLAADDMGSINAGLQTARNADLVVTIGGASVGDHDLIGKLSSEQSFDRAFYKVAMRPGRPLIAGRLAGVPMIGLPGNPVSAMVCGIIFLQPLIRAMLGLPVETPCLTARLGTDLGQEGPRQHYLRARMIFGNGQPEVLPFQNQDSASLTRMVDADALLIRPPHDPPRVAGEMVQIIQLRPAMSQAC